MFNEHNLQLSAPIVICLGIDTHVSVDLEVPTCYCFFTITFAITILELLLLLLSHVKWPKRSYEAHFIFMNMDKKVDLDSLGW